MDGDGDSELLSVLQGRIAKSFSLEKLLFYSSVLVKSHVTKKNGRSIFVNKASGRMFPGKDKKLLNAEELLFSQFTQDRLVQKIHNPFDEPLWVIAHFYFPKDEMFTKKGQISLKLPDLSNLLELPADCLTKAKIIRDDTLIHSWDLSRRLVGKEFRLDIFVLKYDAANL